MIVVPDCVKQTVDRMIKEYKTMFNNGVALGVTITVGDEKYSGLNATRYYLDSVKKFRNLLETQEGYLFEGTEREIRKKIYLQTVEYFDELLGEKLVFVSNAETKTFTTNLNNYLLIWSYEMTLTENMRYSNSGTALLRLVSTMCIFHLRRKSK